MNTHVIDFELLMVIIRHLRWMLGEEGDVPHHMIKRQVLQTASILFDRTVTVSTIKQMCKLEVAWCDVLYLLRTTGYETIANGKKWQKITGAICQSSPGKSPVKLNRESTEFIQRRIDSIDTESYTLSSFKPGRPQIPAVMFYIQTSSGVSYGAIVSLLRKEFTSRFEKLKLHATPTLYGCDLYSFPAAADSSFEFLDNFVSKLRYDHKFGCKYIHTETLGTHIETYYAPDSPFYITDIMFFTQA